MTSDEWVEQMGVTLLDKANLQLVAKEQEVVRLTDWHQRRDLERDNMLDGLNAYEKQVQGLESQVADLKRELAGQQRQLERLGSFRELKVGWDSYDGNPINEEAIRTARAILTTAGQATPMSDGGIQIEWHCGGIDHEIVIQPDGTLEDETVDMKRELEEARLDIQAINVIRVAADARTQIAVDRQSEAEARVKELEVERDRLHSKVISYSEDARHAAQSNKILAALLAALISAAEPFMALTRRDTTEYHALASAVQKAREG